MSRAGQVDFVTAPEPETGNGLPSDARYRVLSEIQGGTVLIYAPLLCKGVLFIIGGKNGRE